MTREQLRDELAMLMGGRVAEEIVAGDVTTGAQNDIERATKVARQMVTEYGMSDSIGPRTLGQKQGEVFLGRDWGSTPDYSDAVALEIDTEVRFLIDEAHDVALEILTREPRQPRAARGAADREGDPGPRGGRGLLPACGEAIAARARGPLGRPRRVASGHALAARPAAAVHARHAVVDRARVPPPSGVGPRRGLNRLRGWSGGRRSTATERSWTGTAGSARRCRGSGRTRTPMRSSGGTTRSNPSGRRDAERRTGRSWRRRSPASPRTEGLTLPEPRARRARACVADVARLRRGARGADGAPRARLGARDPVEHRPRSPGRLARRIGVPVDLTVVASEIGSYKPALGHWTAFFERSSTPRSAHVHVAASLFHDVAPAAELGLTARLDRPNGRDERPAAEPASCTDLSALPDSLDVAGPRVA